MKNRSPNSDYGVFPGPETAEQGRLNLTFHCLVRVKVNPPDRFILDLSFHLFWPIGSHSKWVVPSCCNSTQELEKHANPVPFPSFLDAVIGGLAARGDDPGDPGLTTIGPRPSKRRPSSDEVGREKLGAQSSGTQTRIVDAPGHLRVSKQKLQPRVEQDADQLDTTLSLGGQVWIRTTSKKRMVILNIIPSAIYATSGRKLGERRAQLGHRETATTLNSVSGGDGRLCRYRVLVEGTQMQLLELPSLNRQP
ncbi:hypothetical protein FDECE_14497 [Fusarium decemcellulare]|nr:hypothetical protein FDECE_14497 [Fusarium decemcellulare]